MQDDTVGFECSQDLSRHVLVVKGDDVTLPGEGADRFDVVVVANRRGRHDQCRGSLG